MFTLQEKYEIMPGRKKRLRSKSTRYEKIFSNKLSKLGVKFKTQKAFIRGNGFYFADFYLPRPYMICIEIDGGYHSEPEQVAYDKRRDDYLRRRYIKVIRIKNEDVSSLTSEAIIDMIGGIKTRKRTVRRRDRPENKRARMFLFEEDYDPFPKGELALLWNGATT